MAQYVINFTLGAMGTVVKHYKIFPFSKTFLNVSSFEHKSAPQVVYGFQYTPPDFSEHKPACDRRGAPKFVCFFPLQRGGVL